MTTVRDELTVREREIAQLVACGRRNAEIAAELRIARRTVEWKLTRIYRKLGVRSKVGLAAQIATGESLLAAVERHATEAHAQEPWRWGPSLDDLRGQVVQLGRRVETIERSLGTRRGA